ncbi:MAG TPA: PfkB family carbohydrate kinase [Candidatus Limnocylindria bacterium]|nr:PfkB family carbohydrate kinase [Candidatus Limnocylindria bacterium]
MIPANPDLLIVGGLTVDRFADGSTVAGGSVLHAARATVAAGWRVATITAAGPEAEATAAVEELAGMGPSLVRSVPGSIRYEIRETGGRRRLTLEAAAAELPVTAADVRAFQAAAVLLAPVAGELTSESVVAARGSPVVVAAVQGWLRSLEPGKLVRPLPLASLEGNLLAALDHLDAMVASEEDLAAVGADPVAQLVTLRRQVGDRPLLVVTTGADGAWVDDGPRGRHHLPAPRSLEGIATVGAGDAFAGLLTLALGAGHGRLAAATEAVAATSELLAALTT